MRNEALNAGAAFGFYLVADVITIENLGHQTNVPDEFISVVTAMLFT